MRNYTYSLRISDELKERLWKMTAETGVQHTGLVENFIENLCEFYEKNGEIRPPFVIVPRKDFEQLKATLTPPVSNTPAPTGPSVRSKTAISTVPIGETAKATSKRSGAKAGK